MKSSHSSPQTWFPLPSSCCVSLSNHSRLMLTHLDMLDLLFAMQFGELLEHLMFAVHVVLHTEEELSLARNSFDEGFYFLFAFFRQTSLVSHNTILTLGHMAIALKDVQHTQQSILARFQQRLGDPPSPLDILIINQIGCMLISSLVRPCLSISYPFECQMMCVHHTTQILL